MSIVAEGFAPVCFLLALMGLPHCLELRSAMTAGAASAVTTNIVATMPINGIRASEEPTHQCCSETRTLSDIEPQAYLADVLTRLVNLWPNNRLDELLPWAWATSRQQLARAA